MSSKLSSKIRVFFLRRRKDQIVLSDFDTAKGEGLEDVKEIEVFESGLLTIDERDDLERKLKGDVRYQVQRFVQDAYYFRRLIASALVFLAIYLFLSLVIRDPIPMIDELLFSAAGAVIVWVILSRRSAASSLSEKYKLELYKMITDLKETDCPFLNTIEDYLYNLESEFDIIQVADMLAKVDNDILPDLDIAEEDKTENYNHFLSLLSNYGDKKESGVKTYAAYIKENNETDEKLSARIVRSASADGLDVYLLALYVKLLK